MLNPFDCATCHQQQFYECHGLELPHPEGFTGLTHAEQFYDDAALCDRCHPRQPLVARDACDSCHHPEGPKDSTWIDWHPNVVTDRGAENCFRCHATDTCRTCHRQGPEELHQRRPGGRRGRADRATGTLRDGRAEPVGR